jgi:hypothetical protein
LVAESLQVTGTSLAQGAHSLLDMLANKDRVCIARFDSAGPSGLVALRSDLACVWSIAVALAAWALVLWCSGALVLWYSGTLVLWYAIVVQMPKGMVEFGGGQRRNDPMGCTSTGLVGLERRVQGRHGDEHPWRAAVEAMLVYISPHISRYGTINRQGRHPVLGSPALKLSSGFEQARMLGSHTSHGSTRSG